VIEDLPAAGIRDITSWQTLGKWNMHFRKHETIELVDNNNLPAEPVFFQQYPEANHTIHLHLSKNMEKISSEWFRSYLHDELFPAILEQANQLIPNDEDKFTQPQLLALCRLKNICISTAW
jgi:hypothetical protein